MIKTLFMVLLLMITIAIVYQKNNQKLIIYFSVFSLFAASLYFLNHAPDVALAEIAVGSAFTPLIFLITISKQRTFTVMIEGHQAFEHTNLLNEFCREENLKLKMVNTETVVDDEAKSIFGVFRRQDIDLIIGYNSKRKRYDILCKKSNVMINRFEELAKPYANLRIIRIVDDVMLD